MGISFDPASFRDTLLSEAREPIEKARAIIWVALNRANQVTILTSSVPQHLMRLTRPPIHFVDG